MCCWLLADKHVAVPIGLWRLARPFQSKVDGLAPRHGGLDAWAGWLQWSACKSR